MGGPLPVVVSSQGIINTVTNLSDKADPSNVGEYSRRKSVRNRDFLYHDYLCRDSLSHDCPSSSNHPSVDPAGRVAEVPFGGQ